MLNKNGSNMEPREIPEIISDHELCIPFNVTLSFRLVKHDDCNSFNEGIFSD